MASRWGREDHRNDKTDHEDGDRPECGAVSGRIHSRYRRCLIDLPAHGRIVDKNVETRRFRCVGASCRRRIFVQRLGDAVAVPSARRTARMDGIVHRLGLALGGRPGPNLASRRQSRSVKIPCLEWFAGARHALATPCARSELTTGPGEGCRYGTVICDLERPLIVALLPDRAIGTSAAWLRDRSSIEFIARDRGASYDNAASKGPPQAIQIADRWHLLKTPARAFLMSCARTCTPSANRRTLATSTPHYPVVPNASGGRISNTARRRSTRCCGCRSSSMRPVNSASLGIVLTSLPPTAQRVRSSRRNLRPPWRSSSYLTAAGLGLAR